MFIEILILLLLTWYIVFHMKRRRLYKLASKFEGPSTLPFIGNALECLMSISAMPNALIKNTIKYKSPIRFWFGPHLVLYISNPEDIKTVLNSPHCQTKTPYIYKSSQIVLGRGLVTIPVEEWKRHRRLISPHFNQFNLESFLAVFIHHSKELVKSLKYEEGKEFFNAENLLSNCTIRMVLDALLGYTPDDSSSYRSEDIVRLLKSMQILIIERLSNILYFSEFIYDRTSSGKQLAKIKEEFSGIMSMFVEKWTQGLIEQRTDAEDRVDDSASSKPMNFVEHLLLTVDGVGKLTADELREEIHTFIVAGFDTAAITMGFLLIMLGMHPEVQENIYREVENLLDAEEQLRYEDLNKFEYIERVIKETLRMFPALVGIGRKNEQEIKLENHTIPTGTNILIGILGLHRDPNIWPSPDKFDPDRFLPEKEQQRHPYSWIPFSAGPRNCIGYKFGLIAIKVMIIYIVKNYKISTVYKKIDDVGLSMFIALRATDGYKISVIPR